MKYYPTFVFLSIPPILNGEPLSKPYIAYLTSPFDDNIDGTKTKAIEWGKSINSQTMTFHSPTLIHENPTCTHESIPITIHRPYPSSQDKNDDIPKSTTRKSHQGIYSQPTIYPIHPGDGPGKSIVFTRQEEFLDVLEYSTSPITTSTTSSTSSSSFSTKSKRDVEFPLLFQGSTFSTISPLIHDVNGDGITDAILVDYDGLITVVGLDYERTSLTDGFSSSSSSTNGAHDTHHGHGGRHGKTRWMQEIQLPRLVLRKDWVSLTLNQTAYKQHEDASLNIHHSYFESSFTTSHKRKEHEKQMAKDSGGGGEDGTIVEPVRGSSADIMDQSVHVANQIHQRRKLLGESTSGNELEDKGANGNGNNATDIPTSGDQDSISSINNNNNNIENENKEETDTDFVKRHNNYYYDPYYGGDDMMSNQQAMESGEDDIASETSPEDYYGDLNHDDYYARDFVPYDDIYPNHGYDDYYGAEEGVRRRGYKKTPEELLQDHFYKDEHYVHVPPHVLSTPTYVESFPKWKKDDASPFQIDELIVLAVSYYFDEDEYSGFRSRDHKFMNQAGGDDTETKRGHFVANGMVVFNLKTLTVVSQLHLDLSTDCTAPLSSENELGIEHNDATGEEGVQWHDDDNNGMGAYALSSPTVADLDGDGKMNVLITTGSGYIHCIDLLYGERKFSVQMKNKIEHSAVVEDVVSDTNLEIFALDVSGNVVCLEHDGNTIWHRSLTQVDEDENQDDNAKVISTSPIMLGDVDGNGSMDIVVTAHVAIENKHIIWIYAIDAKSGSDLQNFPREIEMLENDGNDTTFGFIPCPLLIDLHSKQQEGSWFKTNEANSGLHIVQPVNSKVYIIEGSTACTQVLEIGNDISSMVQADDVRGTGSLDLIVTTASGEIVLLDLPDIVPFHPLNTHSRPGAYVHGYSASSGIFVHEYSRHYRDVLGIHIPITFEIFDKRPNILNEPKQKVYMVEIRLGSSSNRPIFRQIYNETGVFTEKVLVNHIPGYYDVFIRLRTTHGLLYEDVFHISYNVNYTEGLLWMILLPLLSFIIPLLFCYQRKAHWEDDDFSDGSFGILGRTR